MRGRHHHIGFGLTRALCVAGLAVLGRAFEDPVGMAAFAALRDMGPAQREACLEMIELAVGCALRFSPPWHHAQHHAQEQQQQECCCAMPGVSVRGGCHG